MKTKPPRPIRLAAETPLPVPVAERAETAATPAEDRLLDIHEVVSRAGFCKAQIYSWMRVGKFPKSVLFGVTTARWSANEVQAWIAAQLETRGDRKSA